MSSEKVVSESFESRWAVWQARGDAHDRTRRYGLIIVAIVVTISAVILSVW